VAKKRSVVGPDLTPEATKRKFQLNRDRLNTDWFEDVFRDVVRFLVGMERTRWDRRS